MSEKTPEQGGLFDGTDAYARNSDPDTSHEAAESIEQTRMESMVYHALVMMGPATSSEIAASMNLARDSVSPRMAVLVDKHMVVNTGIKRPGPSGRRQIVWDIARKADSDE